MVRRGRESSDSTPISLRAATAGDSRLLFDWANDPSTRMMARNQKPIAWPDHEVWLAGKLATAECRIWIVETAGQPVGQVRFDRRDDSAEIDYSVAADRRGEGLGTAMLDALAVKHAPGVARVHGAVRVANQASIRAFLAAGFIEEQGDQVSDGYRRFAKEFDDG